ncbi:hypothetical protein ACFLX4_03330 [Chloroflexota bacterium]
MVQAVVVSERTQAVWEAVIERYCGLDVHQKTVTAGIIILLINHESAGITVNHIDFTLVSTRLAMNY